MRDALAVLRDREFLFDCLRTRVRWDGRKFDESREPVIHFGREWGSVIVCLGESKILAHSRYDLVEPRESRPHEGMLQVNMDYSPVCGKARDMKRSGPWAEILRSLDKLKKDCTFIDLETLCVVTGKRVWEVIIDLTVVADDGNLLECASIALLAALKHFRHPDVTMDGDKPVVHALRDRDPARLTFTHHPVFSTYSFLHKGKYCLADPNEAEESAQDGKLMIAANTFSEICGFHQSGLIPVDPALLRKCSQLAIKRAKYIAEFVKKAIAEDEKRRDRREKVAFSVDIFSRMKLPADQAPADMEIEEDRAGEDEASKGNPVGATAMGHSSDEVQVMPVEIKQEKTDGGDWEMENDDEVEVVERLSAADRVQVVDLDENDGEDGADDKEKGDAQKKKEKSSKDKRQGKGKSKKGSKDQKWFSDQW